jgi:transcriptional regulator GlxA family with amidase domain
MRHRPRMPERTETRHSVALLALPESTPGTLFSLYEVLSLVGVTWMALTAGAAGRPLFDVRIVASSRGTFRCGLGVPITPDASFEETGTNDIVIVTDLDLLPDVDPRERWSAEAAWLRSQYEREATICSVCTGSVLLAAAGLLDGEEATCHWAAAGVFERHFPDVRLRSERILTTAGPAHRLVTSGGSASWMEMALYLVARFCGEAEAVRTAKVFVLGDRSEGQLVYSVMPAPRRHEDAIVAECQRWLADHYAGRNPVARMISKSGLSERTFKRRFRAATGYAPIEYVQALRVEEAKQMLETSDEATDAVASSVGYQDPTFFRRLFKRRTGVTPARYRQRFRTIGRGADA